MTRTMKIESGDIQYNVDGSVKMVVNGFKVKQDVRELLSIEVIEGFGADLVNLIGTVDRADFIRGTIYRRIVESVNQLILLQRGRQRGQRPNSELIDSIQLLQVVLSENDPTAYIFKLDLKTIEDQIVTLQGEVSPTLVGA